MCFHSGTESSTPIHSNAAEVQCFRIKGHEFHKILILVLLSKFRPKNVSNNKVFGN